MELNKLCMFQKIPSESKTYGNRAANKSYRPLAPSSDFAFVCLINAMYISYDRSELRLRRVL